MTLCNTMDCSPSGSSVYSILQARILKWVAIPFSRVSSQPRDQIQIAKVAGRFFTVWSREALRKSNIMPKTKKSTSATLTMLKPLTGWITTNCKIPKEMRIPVHLNCLLRNLYAGQEATVRTGHGKWTGTKLKKGVCQGCKLSPCLCKLYAEDIMCNAGL